MFYVALFDFLYGAAMLNVDFDKYQLPLCDYKDELEGMKAIKAGSREVLHITGTSLSAEILETILLTRVARSVMQVTDQPVSIKFLHQN